MPNPFSNRKKVRGWKRRIRQLERFRLAHRELDVEALRLDQRHYVKIWLDPWSRLVRRNPPHWFRRRIVAAFIDIHDAWRERLEAAGEPYYLEIWLFHPDFHDSQVVAAVGDAIGYYRTMFDPAEDAPAQPPAEYRDAAYDLDDLHWRVGQVIDVRMASTYAGDSEALVELAELGRSADRVQATADGTDTLYIFHKGLVWLGSRPSDLNPGTSS
ncbi:hypothetical protein [Longimicrobium sp.]|uniref:hypothetical protein n=1 Tax=Longimicrobium sp. TaxID=2029185 RepID=UPI003B3B7E37